MRSGSRERRTSQASRAVVQGLPEFAVSLFIILLMWLFAELIFLPLAAESFTENLSERVTSIVAAAFVVAIAYLLPRTARKGDVAVKSLSSLLVKGRYEKAKQAKMQRAFESLGRALLSAVFGIIVSSLLYWIHPLLGGIALLLTIITAFMFIIQGANQASEEILQKLAR